MAISHKGWDLNGDKNFALRIVSGQTVAEGDFAALVLSAGRIRRHNDAATYCPVGLISGPAEKQVIAVGTGTGDESDPGVRMVGGGILKDVAVTGVSSVADIGKWVYGSDHETLTLTRPTYNACPIGYVAQKKDGTTTTTCSVYVFSLHDQMLMRGSNRVRHTIANVQLSQIADTNTFRYKLFGAGKIVEIGVMPWKPVTTASKAATLTASLVPEGGGGTPVAITGGALALISASLLVAGTVQSVTPTAANTFGDKDDIVLVASSVTAFGEGEGALYIDVEYLPGA